MSDETKSQEPTKLTWFWSRTEQISFIREHLASLPDLVNHLGYGFEFQMPSVACDVRKSPPLKTEKYINWRGKERERELPSDPNFLPYQYYLVFNRVLTDDELKFWRIIKLGYLARDFDPDGSWRNK